MTYQTGILAPVPRCALYLTFNVRPHADKQRVLAILQQQVDGEHVVVGLGKSLLLALGVKQPTLPNFPAYSQAGINIPATATDLWCWLRGDDAGQLWLQSQALILALAAEAELVQTVTAFKHLEGRDLTGYEDGTENPQEDAAITTAIVSGQGQGRDGASFVAVQQWQHNMAAFYAMSQEAQDHMIGRRRANNEELDEAPVSAHVKRTAQESFSPEAFVLRRSMPWSAEQQGGLMFVAFGHSLDAFAAQLRRMVGLEDGVSDALFQISRPITGAYYWCPPLKDGQLDWSALLGGFN